MTQEDPLAGKPLRFGKQDIILAHFFQNLVADHVGIVPEMIDDHDRHGQDEMEQPVRDAVAVEGICPGAWQKAQLHGEDQDQHESQPELGDGARHRAGLADEPIRPPPLVPGAKQPQEHGAAEDQQESKAAEDQRVLQPAFDDFQRGHLVFVRNAEIPRRRPLQPPCILDGDGVMQSQPLLHPCALVRAHALHPRTAYAWAAESTIYIKEEAHARGLGKRLCLALEDELRRMNIVSLNACIAVPRTTDDPYLTENSWKFHEHIGYRLAGRFHQCAYKFDRWYDMIWMEKDLTAHETPPQPVKSWRGFL